MRRLYIKKTTGWELTHEMTIEDALTIAAYFANQGHAVKFVSL